MPKKYPDAPIGSGDGIGYKKTERSHAENQERAYIAASRRGDRSIEARLQSAKMASDIHKQRTGKGFKITEEIVMNEEMYEEEDDDLPRQYRVLGANLQTPSSELNSRMNAYLTNSMAMARLAKFQAVDREFTRTFPQYSSSASSAAMTSTMFHQHHPQQHHQPHRSALTLGQSVQGFPPQSPAAMNLSAQLNRERSQSTSQPSPTPDPSAHRNTVPLVLPNGGPYGAAMPCASLSQHSLSPDDGLSPPALTPGSGSTETPQSSVTPNFTDVSPYPVVTSMEELQSVAAIDDPSQSASPFTSVLPPEVQQMVEWDGSTLNSANPWQHHSTIAGDVSIVAFDPVLPDAVPDAPKARTSAQGIDDYFNHSRARLHSNSQLNGAPRAQRSAALTPASEVPPAKRRLTSQGLGDYLNRSGNSHPTRPDPLAGQRSIVVGTPGGGAGGDNFDAFFDMDQYQFNSGSGTDQQDG